MVVFFVHRASINIGVDTEIWNFENLPICGRARKNKEK
jgi:hypothetical protein